MTGKEIKNIKSDFVKLLKRKGTYDLLIDAIVFSLKLLQDARRDVEARGTMIQLGKDSNFYQVNFAIGIFHNV